MATLMTLSDELLDMILQHVRFFRRVIMKAFVDSHSSMNLQGRGSRCTVLDSSAADFGIFLSHPFSSMSKSI